MPPHVQSFGTSVPLYPELSHHPKLAQAITSRKLVNHDLTYFNPNDMRKQRSNSFGQYYGDSNDVDDSTQISKSFAWLLCHNCKQYPRFHFGIRWNRKIDWHPNYEKWILVFWPKIEVDERNKMKCTFWKLSCKVFRPEALDVHG